MVGFLAERGLENASILEISDGYDARAAELLEASGMTDRVDRRFLDIAQSPDEVEAANVVILHRVVCCYPDYERLLVAGSHARRLLVFSHPPQNIASQVTIGWDNLVRRLRRNDF